MSDEKDHVVWYLGGFSGDCVIFWGPDETGYTTDLDRAGRYTREHAKDIEGRRGLEKAVPFAVAAAATRRHVVADRLREELDKAGEK